jgi:ABC-type hemin transport system substrate-binding protein
VILRCCLTLVLLLELGCSQTAQPEATPDVRSRVISLAPNLTELVFAAGAGDALVGVSAYSDYPVEALALPVVGDAFIAAGPVAGVGKRHTRACH